MKVLFVERFGFSINILYTYPKKFDFVRRIIHRLYHHESIIRIPAVLIQDFFCYISCPGSHLIYKPADNLTNSLCITRNMALREIST